LGCRSPESNIAERTRAETRDGSTAWATLPRLR
jgi:hypothetical protein